MSALTIAFLWGIVVGGTLVLLTIVRGIVD